MHQLRVIFYAGILLTVLSCYRSDHFSFAKQGVPALFIERGIDVVGKGKEYGKQLEDDFNDHHYHRPSDEFDAVSWTMAGGIADLKLLFQLGKRIAFTQRMPEWKTGSEFKVIREGKKQ